MLKDEEVLEVKTEIGAELFVPLKQTTSVTILRYHPRSWGVAFDPTTQSHNNFTSSPHITAEPLVDSVPLLP